MKEFTLRCNNVHMGTIYAEEMRITEGTRSKFVNLIINNNVIYAKVLKDNVKIYEEDGRTIIEMEID